MILLIVSIENRHLVRQVDGQLNQSSHITLFIIPWCLMQELMLAMTDNLIGITFTRLTFGLPLSRLGKAQAKFGSALAAPSVQSCGKS